jgi:hypothetical protein
MVWANAQYVSSSVAKRLAQQLSIMSSASASGVVDSQQHAAASIPTDREEIPQAPIVDGELTAPSGPVNPEAAADGESHAPGADASASRIHGEVQRLKLEQKKLRDERKRIAAELRNAEKKRMRLKSRAQKLSDSDLLAVIQLRRDEKAAKDEQGASSTAAAAGEQTPRARRSRSPSFSSSVMTATPQRGADARAELTAAQEAGTQQS